jgi:hypothetical protein
MQYRVQIDISFSNEQDALDLMNHIEDIKVKARKPNKTEKIECYRTARYHACTHDDVTPTSCAGYIDVDFDKPKQIHEAKKEAKDV